MPAGFKDLHNFAFLGPSGRIGTAQDGIYAYVPAGPHKQFDMFLHSYACYKKGMLQVLPSPFHHNPSHAHLERSTTYQKNWASRVPAATAPPWDQFASAIR